MGAVAQTLEMNLRAADQTSESDLPGMAMSGERNWREVVQAMEGRLEFTIRRPAVAGESFAESVRKGLSGSPKQLSCCWFYDRRGSALFEQICDLPEYYLTRTERSILEMFADDIAAVWPGRAAMIELGSGSSAKTRLLIGAMLRRQRELQYCPIDISREILGESALQLLAKFPGLKVQAIAADYLDGLELAQKQTSCPRLFLFLGSTIGNFEPDEARVFLGEIRRCMDEGDRVLLGTDLRKSREIIQAAYNDSAGVTAAFNKNLLIRINSELEGEFDLDLFQHHAPYLEEKGRVEMRLASTHQQDIWIGALSEIVHFERGETIFTESCHKYDSQEIARMASDAGLDVQQTWHDPARWFALSLLAPRR